MENQATTPPADSDRRPRVLLVDDSAEDLRMYGDYLRFAGYDVETAPDGALGLDMALTKPFDVVVVDIAMPKLDGIGLLMLLRNYKRTRRMPIVTLSARTGPEIRAAARDAGADVSLEKPCPPEDLAAALHRLIGRDAPPAAPAAADQIGADPVAATAEQAPASEPAADPPTTNR